MASNSFSRCISTDGSTGKGLVVVLCCACLRVRARVSIVLCMSKGKGYDLFMSFMSKGKGYDLFMSFMSNELAFQHRMIVTRLNITTSHKSE